LHDFRFWLIGCLTRIVHTRFRSGAAEIFRDGDEVQYADFRLIGPYPAWLVMMHTLRPKRSRMAKVIFLNASTVPLLASRLATPYHARRWKVPSRPTLREGDGAANPARAT
jgi:hypothetical protein